MCISTMHPPLERAHYTEARMSKKSSIFFKPGSLTETAHIHLDSKRSGCLNLFLEHSCEVARIVSELLTHVQVRPHQSLLLHRCLQQKRSCWSQVDSAIGLVQQVLRKHVFSTVRSSLLALCMGVWEILAHAVHRCRCATTVLMLAQSDAFAPPDHAEVASNLFFRVHILKLRGMTGTSGETFTIQGISERRGSTVTSDRRLQPCTVSALHMCATRMYGVSWVLCAPLAKGRSHARMHHPPVRTVQWL